MGVMKKLINWSLTIIAIVGFFVLIGSVGKMDFMLEKGIDYPLINTIKSSVIGILMILPAIIREVFI